MKDESTEAIARALEALNEKLDGAVASRRSRRDEDTADDDAPRSVHTLGRGRNADPLGIQGVLLAVRIPIGRRGETVPGYLLFPPVEDERALMELAENVERRYKLITVYQPRNERKGYSNGYSNGYNRERGEYGRGRDFSRDWERR